MKAKIKGIIKRGGLLIFAFILILNVLVASIPAPSVSAATSSTDSHGCTSSQYWSPPDNLGYTSGQCLDKVTNPRNASDCPANYTYSNPLGSGGTCTPNGPQACTSSQYWVGPGIGNGNGQCVDKATNPRSQSDCPKNYNYQNSSGINGQGKCVPAGPQACTSSQYYEGPTLTNNNGQCLDKATNPRNQSDCPANTTYTPATGTAGASCQASQTTATGNGNGNGNSTQQLTCDTEFSSPLTWIICPVVDVLVKIINVVNNIITDALHVNTNNIFCGNNSNPSCTAYYTAWQTFRNIALSLMAVAGLIIVTSQALGFEMLDAYTLRKTLPRLLIAAIGITLSWPLMQFFVNLSNDLGIGIYSLIQVPFKSKVDLTFGGNAIASFFGSTIVAGGVGIAAVPIWIAGGGIGILFAYAASAFLAIFVAIVVLALRQVAIILLIILAPVAIVAYILPHTERMYKIWWESFSKALMMFPIITGFIAAGQVFSAISLHQANTTSDTATGLLYGFIGFAAYFAPYFMIPATFKLAGGAIRQLGGFVNDRSRGGFDRLRQFRANQSKGRIERARARGLYRADANSKGIRRLGHYMNKIGHYTLDADEQLPYDFGTGTGLGRLGRGKYNPIGRTGQVLFGSIAQEMAEKKAGQFAEHTLKGLEESKIGYAAGWAALGMRHRLASGFSEEGLHEMDTKYGLDEDGNRTTTRTEDGRVVSSTGKAAVSWVQPQNDDTAGLISYAQDLQRYSVDGSHAKFGGAQLEGRAGVLTRFGVHQETQRATLSSVAAAAVAEAGKFDPDEVAKRRNEKVRAAHGDPTAIGFAAVEMEQLERLSSRQHRQDLRPGKGIRMGTVVDPQTGARTEEAYSVFSDQLVTQRDADGQEVEVPAYQTKEALDELLTAKSAARAQGKGEQYVNIRKAAVYHGSDRKDDGELTDSARELRKALVVQDGTWSGTDAGARLELQKILDDLGVTPEERNAYMAEYSRSAGANLGGGPPVEPPPEAAAGPH